MFGGNDGTRALNDVYFMEIERLSWGYLPVHVSASLTFAFNFHMQHSCLSNSKGP